MLDLFWFIVKVYLSTAACILFKWCWDTRKETQWNLTILLVRIILVLGWFPLMVKAWHEDGDYPFQEV